MLEAKNLHKIYNQVATQLHVLKGISINIQEGEIIAITGPSGAGKSTLIHILGGLDKPSEGHVLIEHQDIYRLNDMQRSKIRNEKVGFIFQFYHLLPEFSALENVMLPALIGEQYKWKSAETKALSLLDQVGLNERIQHKPNQLSGGEQQRVAIARSLINEPKIIFCDEPTGNLDSESGQAVIELLLDLNNKSKQTLIIVTHDKNIAQRCQRIIKIKDGGLVN